MKALSRFAPLVFLAFPLVLAFGCSKDSNPTNPGGGGGGGPTFDSGVTGVVGHSFRVDFTQDGAWTYHCTVHGASMSGTITVAATGVDSQVVAVGSGGNNYGPAAVNLKNGGYVRWVWAPGTIQHSVTR